MFTIKFMKEGGYTAYECVSYGVSWEPSGTPIVYMRTTRNSRDSEVDPLIIPVEDTAYVENSAGRTIDKIIAQNNPAADQSNPIPAH